MKKNMNGINLSAGFISLLWFLCIDVTKSLTAIEDYWKVDPCFNYRPVADCIACSRLF